MPEESTIMLAKPGQRPVQSTIFNTSIRGWIALILALGLTLSLVLLVVGYLFGVKPPVEIVTSLMTLFSAGFMSAVTHYFQQNSREGQK